MKKLKGPSPRSLSLRSPITYGRLKAVPFKKISFSAACEARTYLSYPENVFFGSL
jgi:hypothetical protein